MRSSLMLPLALCAIPLPAMAEEIGECRFDRDTLTFAGTPLEQATCLLRKIELFAVRKPQPVPPVIVRLMTDAPPPSPAQKAAAIEAFPEPYRTYARQYADAPVSQTEEGLPLQYYVIHDTSTPFYKSDPFPRNLNKDEKVNSFQPYMTDEIAKEPVAHIFLNRVGQIWAGHEFRGAMARDQAGEPGRRAPGARALRPHRNGTAAPLCRRCHHPRRDRGAEAGLHPGAVPDAGGALRLRQRARRALADPGAA
ncbi:hypothetical protein OKA06_08030 [Novosphingobium sp. MW5]|nr:hypothetical protein [Novosphingobium sp. MW5]